MIERGDVILVDGFGYTVAELEADPVLAERGIYWWRGRQQARLQAVLDAKAADCARRMEREAQLADEQAKRSKGGKTAAENAPASAIPKLVRTNAGSLRCGITANPTLKARQVAQRIINRGLTAKRV